MHDYPRAPTGGLFIAEVGCPEQATPAQHSGEELCTDSKAAGPLTGSGHYHSFISLLSL